MKMIEISFIRALSIAAAIVTTTTVVVWSLRADRIEQLNHEIEVLKGSKDWKLPETLKALNEVSEKVRLDVAERNKLKQLEADHIIHSEKFKGLGSGARH